MSVNLAVKNKNLEKKVKCKKTKTQKFYFKKL